MAIFILVVGVLAVVWAVVDANFDQHTSVLVRLIFMAAILLAVVYGLVQFVALL